MSCNNLAIPTLNAIRESTYQDDFEVLFIHPFGIISHSSIHRSTLSDLDGLVGPPFNDFI